MQKDADCVQLASAAGIKMQCLHGICILDRNVTGTCYSHADCQATKKWCSGNGKCVDSILQVLTLFLWMTEKNEN